MYEVYKFFFGESFEQVAAYMSQGVPSHMGYFVFMPGGAENFTSVSKMPKQSAFPSSSAGTSAAFPGRYLVQVVLSFNNFIQPVFPEMAHGCFGFAHTGKITLSALINTSLSEVMVASTQGASVHSLRSRCFLHYILRQQFSSAKDNCFIFISQYFSFNMFLNSTRKDYFSKSLPLLTKSCTVSLCVMRTTSCSMIGPASSSR